MFTLLLIGLSGASLALAFHSFGQLLGAFDVLFLLLLFVSLYATIVGVYAIITIFYNVDKLGGRQKRTLKFLELYGIQEEDRE